MNQLLINLKIKQILELHVSYQSEPVILMLQDNSNIESILSELNKLYDNDNIIIKVISKTFNFNTYEIITRQLIPKYCEEPEQITNMFGDTEDLPF